MELPRLDSLVPLELRIPVVGEEAHVDGDVVSDSTGELGGSEHHTCIEEPSVGETEALDDLSGGHA